ncbi:GlcNAc deacetylase-related protein, carbohydrate esterase family 4 protein [unidentified eubacterium SCB49]|nr:GlcNAc deacetylase-related protein, carbohydrate esterase family 4 protein [unidentified eubacterium SCB49]
MFSRKKPTVYLTFDDGPIPEVTPWVLQQLKQHNAQATFFCIGDNVAKHPEIATQILNEGHSIGNHTFHHKNGWKTSFEEYLKEFELFNSELKKSLSDEVFEDNKTNQKSNILFRPPYGKMTSSQAKAILKKGCKIIMWHVLSGDYDKNISETECLENVLKNIEKGSIIVFHDSLKAEKNLKFVLPKVLEYIQEKGWSSQAIN